MFTQSRKHLKYVIEVVPWYAKFQPNVQKYLLIFYSHMYLSRERGQDQPLSNFEYRYSKHLHLSRIFNTEICNYIISIKL